MAIFLGACDSVIPLMLNIWSVTDQNFTSRSKVNPWKQFKLVTYKELTLLLTFVKTLFVGANTVKGPSAERASTSPAAETAAKREEKSEFDEKLSGMDKGLEFGKEKKLLGKDVICMLGCCLLISRTVAIMEIWLTGELYIPRVQSYEWTSFIREKFCTKNQLLKIQSSLDTAIDYLVTLPSTSRSGYSTSSITRLANQNSDVKLQ